MEREKGEILLGERERRWSYRMAVGDLSREMEKRKEKERKRKEIKKINILILLYWPKIRTAPNGAQKLQKLENISLRWNMKTVCRNSIRFAN